MIKLFCKHEWIIHTKKEYEWDEKRPIRGTEYWYKPIMSTQHISETVEVLICKKCGKINKLTY